MLLAATWALITGRMMKEEWLPTRELDQIWYQLHLAGWVILVVCLIMHLLMSIKVGGLPLIVSIFEFKYRPEDSPTTWLQQIRSFFSRS
jgi:thiosulfate reductase cytochrome b subunit